MDNLLTSLFSDMDISSWIIFLCGTLAVFAAAIAQGATGFGFGMIAAPVLMIINPAFVPGPLLVLALIISTLTAIRERSNIDWKGLSIATVGRVIGSFFAGLTIAAIPLAIYGIVFGVLILVAVLLSASGWKVLPSAKNLATAGFTSGYMGTLTSIGAPPMALAYQNQTGPIIRSTLAMFFVIGAIMSIIILIAFERFSTDQVFISFAFLPPLVLGFFVSGWVAPKVRGRRVRYSVLILSAITSLVLITKSIVMI